MTDDNQTSPEIIDDASEDEEELEPAAKTRPATLAAEPLFSTLLRSVITKVWPNDTVMSDFVAYVVGPLSDRLGHVAAKGGEFVEHRRAEGLTVEERYTCDQSMRAHLVNGLFSTLHVARLLQEWGAPQFRYYDDTVRRILIAGYILHDYLKLPDVEQRLEESNFSHDRAVGPEQMLITETIFREWCVALGLDRFLEPLGGMEAVLHDLIYVACNAQTRWGTLHNLGLLPRLKLEPVQLDLAEQLSRLADYLAYIARTPPAAAADPSIQRELATLSNRTARLTFHHLADNRGVLTNFIHNAAMKAMGSAYRVPLLYAPSGVVYLERKDAPAPPDVSAVAEAVIRRIQEVINQALRLSRKGFRRDGKGIKYADYYWLFFELGSLIEVSTKAMFDSIREGKKPSSGKRFAKMRDQRWVETTADLDLPDDLRVDQLAEWCYLVERQVGKALASFDVADLLLKAMELDDLRGQFEAVPRDNRAGGVGYHWYFAAGHYLKRHPGLDPASWREKIEGFANRLVESLRATAELAALPGPQDAGEWNDLRTYIVQNLTLGPVTSSQDNRDSFAAELQRYQNAKKRGQTTGRICSLCSSSFLINKQREAAVLFAPQVYSNKLPLHGAEAIRDICTICGMEMMLRQILMSHSGATGGDFEGRRIRYLYLYPTYFFTPETLELVRQSYMNIRNIRFSELSHQLVKGDGTIDLSSSIFQRLEPLLLIPEEERGPTTDRYVRLHFPEHEPVTFYFLGVPPPGREAKDAESWVHPAFLSLVLPLCLDVKVVASESSLPLILEADEIPETVFLDGPHAAINYLTHGQLRINVDRVLSTLQRLVVGYLIHIDANSAQGDKDFYRWQHLPALARALDQSPLFAFHYLKKWQRKKGLDSIPAGKARQYLKYAQYLNGGTEMSHAQQLTELYLQFYRAIRYNSNSYLRPITIAANTILDADPRLFDQQGLVEAVYGQLCNYIERAQREGLAYFPKGSTRQSREQAMRGFSAYFVDQVFYGTFRGDKSALRGKQLNLLKSACEVIYVTRLAQERNSQAPMENAGEAPAEG